MRVVSPRPCGLALRHNLKVVRQVANRFFYDSIDEEQKSCLAAREGAKKCVNNGSGLGAIKLINEVY